MRLRFTRKQTPREPALTVHHFRARGCAAALDGAPHVLAVHRHRARVVHLRGRQARVERAAVLLAVVEAIVEDNRRALLRRDLKLELGERGASAHLASGLDFKLDVGASFGDVAEV